MRGKGQHEKKSEKSLYNNGIKRQRKNPNTKRVRGNLAAELGIEPRQRDSETLVLPLHNSAMETVFIIPVFLCLSRKFPKITENFT